MLTPAPEVELINAFAQPYNNAVATARTCYAPRVIYPDEVAVDAATRARRDAIAQSTYVAGHHTTLQHATFQFALKKVSRHMIWSFLHSHPFYNSEQVSQRYVAVKPEHFSIPSFRQEASCTRYLAMIDRLMEAYQHLMGLIAPTVREAYQQIFPKRPLEEKRWQNALRKKTQEVARYVLPVATHAHLYHTISGLTLHRYHRLCQQFDVPEEQRQVVDQMVAAVVNVDPEFAACLEDPIPLEETLEYAMLASLIPSFGARSGEPRPTGSVDFLQTFDASLDGYSSKLIDYKVNGEKVMAESVRSVLGVTDETLHDDAALAWIMDPAHNPLFSESLNITTHAKLTRTMVHPHFTFRKKMSHTADSQDQRHRMTPASRPILSRHVVFDHPDYVVPEVVARTPLALTYYQDVMAKLWQEMAALVDAGESVDSVLYLLPNAVAIRYEESGDLLNFHHKWTSRLCYTAQEEIWRSCVEEVQQVEGVYPHLAKFLRPPCTLRQRAGKRPYCPEGDRYCGVPVWKLPLEAYARVI